MEFAAVSVVDLTFLRLFLRAGNSARIDCALARAGTSRIFDRMVLDSSSSIRRSLPLSVVPRDAGTAEVGERIAKKLCRLRREYRLERQRLIDATLAVDAKTAGALFGLSERGWRRLDVTGEIPRPKKLGRSVRWQLAELAAWIQAGCPDRETWEAMK